MFCTLCSGFFTPGGNSMAPSACQGWQSNFSKSIFTPSRIFVCWANQQTKQAECSIFKPVQRINNIGVIFRSQLTQCRLLPQCSSDWQSPAKWGNVATTAGHLPAMARADCCLLARGSQLFTQIWSWSQVSLVSPVSHLVSAVNVCSGQLCPGAA